MRLKESVAVMVAVMLGAASLLGGLAAPALATHDPDATLVPTKQFAKEDDEITNIGAVEFNAKKSTLRASGKITVAIVQDDMILYKNSMSTSGLSTTYVDRKADFDVEVTGTFQVVIMYEGSGSLQANSIKVPGVPTPAPNPDPDPDPDPNPDGTFSLTINAVDGEGNAVNGMWIEVYEGMVPDGSPDLTGFTAETFELEAGSYTIAMANHESNIFQKWSDSETSRARVVQLQQDKTLTAIYGTDGTEPVGDPDPNPDPNPPPTGSSGSIAVFAYRIPSEFWGPTFTGANAQMWFTVHNSTGYAILGHGSDEGGYTFAGLSDGEQYMVVAHDCDECHGDPHDVLFDRWEDGGTDRVIFATTGDALKAYFAYAPDP